MPIIIDNIIKINLEDVKHLFQFLKWNHTFSRQQYDLVKQPENGEPWGVVGEQGFSACLKSQYLLLQYLSLATANARQV